MKESPAAIAAALIVVLAACSAPAVSPQEPGLPPGSPQTSYGSRLKMHRNSASGEIQHVVIIIQENRTVDNLFQFLPGANTQSWGDDSQGTVVPLQPEDMTAPYDLGHVHGNWTRSYNAGAMNGFNLDDCTEHCPADPEYAYVPQDEVQEYYTLAQAYAFADDFFQGNQGPSFPAHQYLVSGTSTVSDGSMERASNNPVVAGGGAVTGGCDSPAGSKVRLIDYQGHESQYAFPCFQRTSLMNEIDTAGLTWRYYQAQPGAGLWNAVDAIESIWSNKTEFNADVVTPSSQFLTDIANGELASVTWITPTGRASDHPGITDGSGPSWVGNVVNAIGASPFWNSTAIFITWDDWGGFYDHVAPTIYNSYELGFRVPLIVVSPYAKSGYVSHVQHEFGSILKFTELVFGLPSMGTTDKRADDLFDCFDFTQPARRFISIRTKFKRSYFFHQPNVAPED